MLASLMPQARSTGAEILIVGATDGVTNTGVRLVAVDDDDMLRLRMVGAHEARGEIVAFGEDHAIPRADWCEAIIRAHAERPDMAVIVGCFCNGTSATLAGRANFFSYASPYGAPMPVLPQLRPPPISLLSFRRRALEGACEEVGDLEAILVPKLFDDGQMAANDRVLADHYQDHGVWWSIVNGFNSARASYGYQRRRLSWRARIEQARWSIIHWPPRLLGEAREATRGEPGRGWLLAVVGMIVAATAVGAAMGSLLGPGSSPDRVP
ncbi:MAG: hypothetical protein ABSG64_10845 [Solirubrobacteraceae bacterium]